MIKQIAKLLPTDLKIKIKDLLYGKSVEETYLVYKLLKNRKGKKHVMIDVGAHHGDALLPFSENGWTVFAFEPDAKNLKKLKKQTANLKNLVIDTRAVSDTTGKEVSFFTSEVSAGISSMAAFHKSHEETAKVKTVRLSDFCAKNAVNNVDFLKIDTEGFDLFVLKGFDWEKQAHPDYIVTEFEDGKTMPLGYTFVQQCAFLEDKGYQLLISEFHPIIAYGKRHKWKRFTTSIQSIQDEKAWGNIIATKPENFPDLLNMAKKFGKTETH